MTDTSFEACTRCGFERISSYSKAAKARQRIKNVISYNAAMLSGA